MKVKPTSLTISQLAAHVGVTVRAVRHYHARGLLQEPPRDASGYRRYNAQAVIDLIRIKTLADAGVPLARTQQLLDAPPAAFAAAVTAIDRTLQNKIREMQKHRRRLAQLAEGDKLFLPADIVDILDQLRSIGVSERSVQLERDGWILVTALLPNFPTESIKEKKALLADPGFQRLYLATDQARDWDPADPRFENLVESLVEYHQGRGSTPPTWSVDDPTAVNLLFAHVANAAPAWQRLGEIIQDRLSASATESTH